MWHLWIKNIKLTYFRVSGRHHLHRDRLVQYWSKTGESCCLGNYGAWSVLRIFWFSGKIVKELSWSYSDIHVCNDVVSLWSWTHWHCLLYIPLLLVKCSRANSYHLPSASIGIIYTAQGKGGFLLIASSLAVVSPHMCSVHCAVVHCAAHKSS